MKDFTVKELVAELQQRPGVKIHTVGFSPYEIKINNIINTGLADNATVSTTREGAGPAAILEVIELDGNSRSHEMTYKPPVGLKPRETHDRKRMAEIKAAINRYIESDYMIPGEWLDELHELKTRYDLLEV